jgi:hypothetical protein
MSRETKKDWHRWSSPFSSLVNTKPNARPNLVMGAIGTGVFVFAMGSLLYQKYCYEQQQKLAREEEKQLSLELILSGDDS